MFEYLGKALSWKTQGGIDLLCRVCLLAAVSSALFTNDSTCVVLTGFVLKLCREKNLDPKPYLLALACSANIGSAATPIGNPQNLVIAVSEKLGFGQFVLGMLPAVVVGLALNMAGLLLVYGRSLSLNTTEVENADSNREIFHVITDEDDGEKLNTTSSGSSSSSSDESSSFINEDEEKGPLLLSDAQGGRVIERRVLSVVECVKGEGDSSGLKSSWRSLKEHQQNVSKLVFFLFIVAFWIGGGMLQVFDAGMGLPWTAITAALVLSVVDFSDATETLDKVL